MAVDRHDGTPAALRTAETTYKEAGLALHRQAVAAELRARRGGRGLHYASISNDRNGPHVVVHNGEVIGEIRTNSPGVLHDWHARPVGGESELGPFVSARAAAAGLLKRSADQ